VKRDIAKPAFFSITNPKDGKRILQIGAGVLAPVVSGTFFDLDALLDYQRDSTTDKEQDSFKAGATGEWRFSEMSLATNRHDTAILTLRGDFRNDVIKTTKGWQVAAAYTHLFEGQKGFPRPNLPFRFGGSNGWLEMVYSPLFGLEVERTVVANDVAAEGVVVRPIGQLSTALYPAPLKIRQHVEVILSYTYREDIKDTTNAVDDSHPFFAFELNLSLLKTDRGDAGFGISYARGDDPDEGLDPTNAWKFGFKVRLK
jgi:hypothetical protein